MAYAEAGLCFDTGKAGLDLTEVILVTCGLELRERGPLLTLPADVPANLFWSVTVYDAKTAAGLNNGQDYPSIGARDMPIQNTDGSTELYFGPQPPEGMEKNWVGTVPGKGWFSVLRLYGPEQGFFDRTWIPGDFVKMK